MNKFTNMFGEAPKLNLRHIVYWLKNNQWSGDLMIYQTLDNMIGLVDVYDGLSYPKVFSDLEELKNYLENLETDNHTIFIRDDWCAYTP